MDRRMNTNVPNSSSTAQGAEFTTQRQDVDTPLAPTKQARRPKHTRDTSEKNQQAPKKQKVTPRPTDEEAERDSASLHQGPWRRSPMPEGTLSLNDMTPTLPFGWTSQIKIWGNWKAQRTCFDVYGIDINGHVAVLTFFNAGVQRFLHTIQPGQVFKFSGGKIKYSTAPGTFFRNKVDITFDQNATLNQIATSDFPCPQHLPHIQTINHFDTLLGKDIVSTIGVIKEHDPVKDINTKQGKHTSMRLLLLVDDTGTQVRCCLWGSECLHDTEDLKGHTLLLHRGQISDYNETRSINVGGLSRAILDPPLPRAKTLSTWFQDLDESFEFSRLHPQN